MPHGRAVTHKRSVTAGSQTEASLIHIVVFLSSTQPLTLLWCPTHKASGSRVSEHNEPIKGTGRELKCPGLLVWEDLGKAEEMLVLPHRSAQIWGKLSSQGPPVHFLCFGEVGEELLCWRQRTLAGAESVAPCHSSSSDFLSVA